MRLLAAALLTVLLAACVESPQKKRAGEVQQACINAITGQLKAPATAKFSSDTQPAFVAGKWIWEGHVDAQNSFGALIRTKFRCTAGESGPLATAELANEKGIYPTDAAATHAVNINEAATQAQEAINLCLNWIQTHFPDRRDLAWRRSCFYDQDMLPRDQTREFTHVPDVTIDRGDDGSVFRLSVETINPPQLWEWENGKATKAW